MGICCVEPDDDDNGVEMDLPAPNLDKIKDKYQRFELSLPFARSNITHFTRHINAAEKHCGGHGFCSVESLKAEFRTPAWSALRKQGTPLKKFLASPHFKDESKE